MLKWAAVALGYTLSQATILQGICAVGIAVGAGIAARYVPLHRSPHIVPVGIAMGLIVIVMVLVNFPCIAVWALFGSSLRGLLRRRPARLAFNIVMALALAATGVIMVV